MSLLLTSSNTLKYTEKGRQFHLHIIMWEKQVLAFPGGSDGKKSACKNTLSFSLGMQDFSSLPVIEPVPLHWRVSVWVCVCVCVCVSCSVVSNSLQPHRLQSARLLCPWDSPGKNTGVGCHALLQGVFLAQGLNPCLLHHRQIIYHLTRVLTTGTAREVPGRALFYA